VRGTIGGDLSRVSFAWSIGSADRVDGFKLQGVLRVVCPSGTASNEALHAEVNRALRCVTGLHRADLHMKLQFFRAVKLLGHNRALYAPTASQTAQTLVINRAVAGLRLWSEAAWRSVAALPRVPTAYQEGMDSDRARSRVRREHAPTRKRPASAPSVTDHRNVFRLRRKTRLYY